MHRKRIKSLLALSLCAVLTSQNVMLIANAEEVDKSLESEVTITPSDSVQLESKENDSNTEEVDYKGESTIENVETIEESIEDKFEITTDESSIQVDPEQNQTYSMGGGFSRSITLDNVETITLTNPNAIGCGTVTTENLNVRSGPSTSYEKIGILKLDENVDVIGKSNGWYKIDFQGKDGYIHASYLELKPIEKGIDVSKWNGDIDWKSVKDAGADYVIIRAGFGSSTVDEKFYQNIKGARDAGLKIGIYWFSYATSVEKAKAEAQKCIEVISEFKENITYPVFFDYEYASRDYAEKQGVTVTKELATEMANTFINTIKSAGYPTGLYTNKDFGNKYFSEDIINSNNLWVAQYANKNTYGRAYDMWQYTEKGKIAGVSGDVDLNYTCLIPEGVNINNDDITDGNENNDNVNDDTTGGNENNDNVNDDTTSGNENNDNANDDTTGGNENNDNVNDDTTGGNENNDNVNDDTTGENENNDNVNDDTTSGNENNDNVNDDTNTENNPSTVIEKGVTTENLNLRVEASTSSKIITTIPKGKTIEIVEKLNSGWYKVNYNGKTGYVSSSYVSINGSTENKPSIVTEKGVTTENLNLRVEASTSSKIITTIPKGKTIEIVEKLNSGWYKVNYNGKTGYVSSSYVSINGSTENKPSIVTEKGVTTANLNLRVEASTSSKIITTIPKGKTIEIVEKLNSGWYKVNYNGKTGYVSSSYVSINGSTENKPSIVTEKGVTTANLNLRVEASTSSKIITTIPKGKTIEIVEKLNSGWYKVNYNGKTGYVSSSYVSINGSTENKPSIVTEKGVTTANLNLRVEASTSSKIITTIPKGQTIEIVEKLNSGWYKVNYNGKTGYVSSSYVSINGSTENKPSIVTEKGVTTANLNLRVKASTSSKIITTIPKGKTIEIVEKLNSGWYKVNYNGKTGYVSSKYVRL